MSNLSSAWETNLPDSLNNPEDVAILRQAVKQWSQLVSWSWTATLAFAGKPKESQERTLKSFFIKTLQKQGQNTGSYQSYAQPESKALAESLAADFKNLLLGRNDEIEFLQQEGISVTLSDVLKKLTGEKYILTLEPALPSKSTFQVVFDTFVGSINQLYDDQGQPKDEYVTYMAYPPRPALGELTVTEEQLYDWVNNLNTLGDYLPPSPYIPIAGSC